MGKKSKTGETVDFEELTAEVERLRKEFQGKKKSDPDWRAKGEELLSAVEDLERHHLRRAEKLEDECDNLIAALEL